ncbi:hypothetical protein AB9E34_06490 [Rhizobium leguminosarum]|uniref:hypothetical protein n=1 Tax=Rhizobium leguminosarum TaxID=384 RepID=UPI000DE556A4
MTIATNVGPAWALEVANVDSIAELWHQVEDCTRCDLYRNATQIVFGEGSGKAIHPSYLLRIRNEADRDQQRRDFVSDLHKAAEFRPR